MNNVCGNCGGYVGDFSTSGDGAKICNCGKQPIDIYFLTEKLDRIIRLLEEIKADTQNK